MDSEPASVGVLMLDIKGKSLSNREKNLLRRESVGGLILFTRNYESPAQLRDLVAEVRSLKPGLLIAVDQEGGRVQRFTDGFVRLPSLGRIGEFYEVEPELAESLAKTCAWVMASELLSYGIDLSFAPVLDIQNYASRVIGDRAFSSDPDVVIALAKSYISGLHDAGMCACGKHYPGHGTVVSDSHVELPVDDRPLTEIMRNDFSIFAQLTDILDGIMPAHVIYPQVDRFTAGFSEIWIEQKLRGELNFQGVVFSDDLSMAAAAAIGSPIERAKRALKVGCDMILVCNDPDSALEIANWLDSESIAKSDNIPLMRSRAPETIQDLFEQNLWESRVQTIRSYFED